MGTARDAIFQTGLGGKCARRFRLEGYGERTAGPGRERLRRNRTGIGFCEALRMRADDASLADGERRPGSDYRW